MIERQVVLPVSPDRLWSALTDPEDLADWFGASVRWDLRPGGPASFYGHDGSRRRGRVTEVRPGRALRFRWWDEEDDGSPDDGDGVSEVAFRLDPDGDGTRLVVTERRVADAAGTPTTPAGAGRDGDHAGSGPAPTAGAGHWTEWDSRLFGVWACASSALTACGGR